MAELTPQLYFCRECGKELVVEIKKVGSIQIPGLDIWWNVSDYEIPFHFWFMSNKVCSESNLPVNHTVRERLAKNAG